MRKTFLYDEHLRLGARMVEFAGWQMPVQYEGVIEEHLAVRENVGIFDVSHMGEIFFRGPRALEDLQWLTSNDVSKLSAGEAQYSLLLNPQGGVVDDIIVYCIEKGETYLVCVNASNTEKDFQWMTKNSKGATIENESPKWSQVAVQGPKAALLISRIFAKEIVNLAYFHFAPVTREGKTWYVARTGYTGEDGFEVFLPNDAAVSFWRELLEKGQDLGVKPIGLGARDTLRTEMKYPLHGNEISDDVSALESGVGWAIKFQKGDFIGRAQLESQRGQIKRKLVGFKIVDKGIPRHGYPLISFDNSEIGKVTSGTMSPSLREPIGIAIISKEWADEGKEFNVQIRGRLARAHVVKTPFVSSKTKV